MRRLVVVLVATGAVASVTAGALTGAAISTAQWGYVVGPPSMFEEVYAATSVRRFTDIAVADAPGPGDATAAHLPADPAETRAFYAEHSTLAEPLGLHRLSLAAAPADAALDVAALIGSLRSAGILVEGNGPYKISSRRLSGAAIELEDAIGRPMLVVLLFAGEVENDHYPRYEVLLTRAGTSWQVQRWHRYFVDIAGIEFLEGPVLFVLATVIGTALYGFLLAVAAGAIIILVRLFQRRGPSPPVRLGGA